MRKHEEERDCACLAQGSRLVRTAGSWAAGRHPPPLSGVFILPASAIHPLLAACSHCSCPLTCYPLKSLLSHSLPVQWTDAPQTKEILKEWLFTLPAHHLSPVVLLFYFSPQEVSWWDSQSGSHPPCQDMRTRPKLGPLDIPLSWKKDWKWSVHSSTPAVEWNCWFSPFEPASPGQHRTRDWHGLLLWEWQRKRLDYITLLYSHSTSWSPSTRPTSPFLSPINFTFQFHWQR